MFALIVMYPNDFESLKEQLIRNQPMEHQSAIAEAFTGLQSGLEKDLQVKFRDKFSQNLNKFCHDVKNFIARPLSWSEST